MNFRRVLQDRVDLKLGEFMRGYGSRANSFFSTRASASAGAAGASILVSWLLSSGAFSGDAVLHEELSPSPTVPGATEFAIRFEGPSELSYSGGQTLTPVVPLRRAWIEGIDGSRIEVESLGAPELISTPWSPDEGSLSSRNTSLRVDPGSSSNTSATDPDSDPPDELLPSLLFPTSDDCEAERFSSQYQAPTGDILLINHDRFSNLYAVASGASNPNYTMNALVQGNVVNSMEPLIECQFVPDVQRGATYVARFRVDRSLQDLPRDMEFKVELGIGESLNGLDPFVQVSGSPFQSLANSWGAGTLIYNGLGVIIGNTADAQSLPRRVRGSDASGNSIQVSAGANVSSSGMSACGVSRIGDGLMGSVLLWCFMLILIGSLVRRIEAGIEAKTERESDW